MEKYVLKSDIYAAITQWSQSDEWLNLKDVAEDSTKKMVVEAFQAGWNARELLIRKASCEPMKGTDED